jgi:hypothetical protein
MADCACFTPVCRAGLWLARLREQRAARLETMTRGLPQVIEGVRKKIEFRTCPELEALARVPELSLPTRPRSLAVLSLAVSPIRATLRHHSW